MFARRLDDRPWELLVMRGVDLPNLLDASERPPDPSELIALAFGAKEEPIVVPDGEGFELEATFSPLGVRRLLGADQETKLQIVLDAIESYRTAARG